MTKSEKKQIMDEGDEEFTQEEELIIEEEGLDELIDVFEDDADDDIAGIVSGEIGVLDDY